MGRYHFINLSKLSEPEENKKNKKGSSCNFEQGGDIFVTEPMDYRAVKFVVMPEEKVVGEKNCKKRKYIWQQCKNPPQKR